MSAKALEHVITLWDSKEHKIEEKLNALEIFIFQHLGLTQDSKYYEKKGKLFHRYIAGFIHRYIGMIKDFSFIIIDPLHIFDILTSFAKGVFTHPIKTLKRIWECWTGNYRKGIYGLGAMTADALLACVIAGATTLFVEEEATMAVGSAVQTFESKMVSNLTSLPRKIAGVAEGTVTTIKSTEEFFRMIQANPIKVLESAKKSIMSGIAYDEIKTYKAYADPFLKENGHV